MDPNLRMLAEQMAKHYTATYFKIKLSKKQHAKQWISLSQDERQTLIETFMVILGQADDEALKEATTVKNPLRDRL
jgi:hypothetical protein